MQRQRRSVCSKRNIRNSIVNQMAVQSVSAVIPLQFIVSFVFCQVSNSHEAIRLKLRHTLIILLAVINIQSVYNRFLVKNTIQFLSFLHILFPWNSNLTEWFRYLVIIPTYRATHNTTLFGFLSYRTFFSTI